MICVRLDPAGLDVLGPVAGDDVAVGELAQLGHVVLHRVSWTYGQRVWNRHAGGGLAGLGRSPREQDRLALALDLGIGIGTAESSVIVYGCSGLS